MSSEQRDRMVEAIACWKLELPGSRERLSSIAADLLAEGCEGPATVEMASIYSEESRFRIDTLVENLISELHLGPELSDGPEFPATRWMCGAALAGEITERSLSHWVHSQFDHESDSEILNELAALDDEYDEVEFTGAPTDPIRSKIRILASEFLGAAQPAVAPRTESRAT